MGQIKATDLEARMEAEFSEFRNGKFPSKAKIERFKKGLTAENLLINRTCDNCRNTVNDFHKALSGKPTYVFAIISEDREPTLAGSGATTNGQTTASIRTGLTRRMIDPQT
jgi:hypothetical protein